MFGLFASLLSSEKKESGIIMSDRGGGGGGHWPRDHREYHQRDDPHRRPLPPRVRLFVFTRATFNSALASRLVFLKEREREREREREIEFLFEFLSRRVVFSLLLCFFLSRSLGFALLTRATNTALSISHRTTIPKIFRMAHRETAHRQAKR